MAVMVPNIKLDVYVRVDGREITVGTIEIPVRVTADYRPGPDATDNDAAINRSARLRLAASAR